MSKQPPPSVVVVASARSLPDVRQLVEELGPSVARSTEVVRAGDVPGQVRRARVSVPPNGVVVVATQAGEVEAILASGADEVLVEPITVDALSHAIRRATLRAAVRDDHGIEARTLRQVIEGLAHSLEGPLAALALDIDALRVSEALEATGDLTALDDCASAIEQAAALVRDAALFAACDDEERPERIEIPALVDQVLRFLGGGGALRAHVERDDVPDLPEITAPRRRLARALSHTLVHALDALCDDGRATRRLRISLRSDEEALSIAVEARPSLDAMPGSTPTTLAATGRLAVAREALRGLDGELVAERISGGGVRYLLFLPRASPSITPNRSASIPSIPAPRPRRSRVLVVDRDERVLRAAARALTDGYDVLVAPCGEEALAILQDGLVDAIVIDARLPDMSGALLADEVRRLRPELSHRIIFVARDREEGRTLASERCPVVDRPLRRSALIAAIDSVLVDRTQASQRPRRELN